MNGLWTIAFTYTIFDFCCLRHHQGNKKYDSTRIYSADVVV
jgi:hypothetical protein